MTQKKFNIEEARLISEGKKLGKIKTRDEKIAIIMQMFEDGNNDSIAMEVANQIKQRTIDKACELIEKLCDSHNIVSIKDGKYKSSSWLEEQFRKAMEE